MVQILVAKKKKASLAATQKVEGGCQCVAPVVGPSYWGHLLLLLLNHSNFLLCAGRHDQEILATRYFK